MPSVSPIDLQKRLGTIEGFLPCRGKANTLSVCMIVKNEEANIERAIRSFLPFADEIIVNDTGSTDKTLEILKHLPKVKLIQSEWKRDFSYSRNLSLDAATCSWCLWMDADDIVPPEQVLQFNKLKTAPLDRAFGFKVINTQGGGKPVGAHFIQIRMFPNHPKIRFERRIHEQIVYSLAQLRLHVFYLDVTIYHMGYEELSQRKSKSERNLELILTEPDRGVDPVVSCQLGDAYMILERFPEAIAAYREVLAIPKAQEINADAYREVFVNIGKAYLSMGQYAECLEVLEKAKELNPGRLDPVFFQGECLFQMKDYSAARGVLEKALQMAETISSQASHYAVMRMFSYKYLCDIASMERNAEVLLKWANAFHKEYPEVVESQIFQGKAHLVLGHYPQAIGALEKAVTFNPTANKDAWYALMQAHELAGSANQIPAIRKRMSDVFGEGREGEIPLLSVAMIVKDEEAHLPACLSSVRGLWDELVIVDTGSKDRTVAIAEAEGARVFYQAWSGDFSHARNRSLMECKGRWIFWLDADDVLLPEDRAQIRKLVESNEPRKAYALLVKNSQDQGLTGAVFNQIRIVPNLQQIRFEGKVHEQLTPALQGLGIPIEFLPYRVIHTGYTDPETVKQKQTRNLELMLSDLEMNPQKLNAMKLFAVGNSYLDLGNFAQATEWYRKAMKQAERIGEDRHILEILPIKLAECASNQGNREDGLAMVNEYLAHNPLQPNGIYLRAQLQEALGKMDMAAQDYGCLMFFQEQTTLLPVDFQQIRIRACKFLGDYWIRKGQQQLALEMLRLGVAVGKGQTAAGLKIASLYFDHEQYSACLGILEFGKRFAESPQVLLSLGLAYIMLDDVDSALQILEEGHSKYPSDTQISQLWTDLKADLGKA